MSGIKYGQPKRNRRKSFAYSIPIYGYLGKISRLGFRRLCVQVLWSSEYARHAQQLISKQRF